MPEGNQDEFQPQELAEMARARATFYHFVGLHFNTLPDLAFVEQLRGEEFGGALASLAENGEIHPGVAAGAALMRDYIQKNTGLEAATFSEKLGVDRTRLYRGVSPAYGPPPPYEAVWTRTGGPETAVLQKVMGLYRTAGLAMAEDANERADYIGVELEYLRLLALREADAWDAADRAAARGILEKEQPFLRSLAEWVPPFVAKAREYVETDFYRGHLQMLEGLLAEELQQVDLLRQATQTMA